MLFTRRGGRFWDFFFGGTQGGKWFQRENQYDETMVGVCKERPTTTPTLALTLQEYHTTCPVLPMYIHIS